MKTKYALIALLAITLWGCDDNTAGLGLGMFPESDRNINGKLSTFDVTTQSIAAGDVYAKTNIGYVGKFTDATFGTYQAGFLAELNCPTGLTFPEVYQEYDANGNPVAIGEGVRATGSMVIDENDKDITLVKKDGKAIGNIYTVEFYLMYDSYFGDSLTACRLSLYDLKENIDENEAYLTNINPTKYKNLLLGAKAYTAVDLSVKDSIRNLSSYTPNVYVPVNNKERAAEIGGNILLKARTAGKEFGNPTFKEAFKGIYVESDYGDGTILYVNQSQMNVVYKCYATDSITGLKLDKKVLVDGEKADSTYYGYRYFLTTREVIQANKLENKGNTIENLITNSTTCTYLKSPAGIFTEATLPIEKINEALAGDTINAVKLTFNNYNQTSDKKFSMSIPSTVMLIRNKYKDSFFINNQLYDGVSSFVTTHSSTSNEYTFSNITNLVNACMSEKETAEKEFAEKGSITAEVYNKDTKKFEAKTFSSIEKWEEETEWNKVVLMPVLVSYDSSSSSSSSSNVIGVQHDLTPGYVRLKGGKEGETDDSYKLKLEVISTNFISTKVQ